MGKVLALGDLERNVVGCDRINWARASNYRNSAYCLVWSGDRQFVSTMYRGRVLCGMEAAGGIYNRGGSGILVEPRS